jgi:hypothetical protein
VPDRKRHLRYFRCRGRSGIVVLDPRLTDFDPEETFESKQAIGVPAP